MNISDYKKIRAKLPKTAGVYFFKKGQKILYIGRATSLQSRIKSYFDKDIIATRGPLIHSMVFSSDRIDFQKTDSVLEAIILEAELIKKHKPYYNTKEKDDKSFNLLVITRENFPRVLIMRSKEFAKQNPKDFLHIFGPFTSALVLRQAIKTIRKIFPFRDFCTPFEELKDKNKSKPCFNHSIGLCPGICVGLITAKEYKKTINQLALFMKGKRQSVYAQIKKEMALYAKKLEFEKANELKRRLYSLDHIREGALIFDKLSDDRIVKSESEKSFRIEGFDTAHLGGDSAIGVMVVNISGEFNRADFRTFNIREAKKADDLGALKEILERRFKHTEWQFPDMVVIDGGLNHLKLAKKVIEKVSKGIKVVSVVKDERHKVRAIIGRLEDKKLKDLIIKVNDEAHRFSIQKHRKSFRKRLFT